MSVGHFRSLNPHKQLEKYYGDEFEVSLRIPGLTALVTEEDLGRFEIINFHRRINQPGAPTLEWIKKFKEAGAVVVGDHDDHFLPPHGHPARQAVLESKAHFDIVAHARASDYVTTTTQIFKDVIAKETGFPKDKIEIFPNLLEMDAKMWNTDPIPSDRVRVGYIGGSSHEKDIDLMKGTFKRLYEDVETKDKIQIVMCGYDTKGSMTVTNPLTGEKKTRKIKPEESVWNKFEAVFNANGIADENQYVRRHTMPITQYGMHYDYCDVCLAPLVGTNTFNIVKSELKALEAGVKHKSLIASDVAIYHEVLEHEKTALLVNPKKNHKDWYRMIKRLVVDDDLRNKLADNLNKFVLEEYDAEKWTAKRAEFYRRIVR